MAGFRSTKLFNNSWLTRRLVGYYSCRLVSYYPCMDSTHPLRIHRLRAAVVGSVLVALAASGCAASAQVGDASPSNSGEPADPTASTVWTDEDTCAAFGDVLTILNNTGAAVVESRMSDQEQQGWLRLATRVQDHISAASEGPVAEALADLKEAAPAIPAGSADNSAIGSNEWMQAGTELREACTSAGYEVVSEGFVGG